MGVFEGPWKSVRVLGKSVEVRESPEEGSGKDTGAPHFLSRDFLRPSPVSQPAWSHPLSCAAVPRKPGAVASLAALVSRPLFSYFCQLSDRVVCDPVRWSFQVCVELCPLVMRICHPTILHSPSKTCALSNELHFFLSSFVQHVSPAKKTHRAPSWLDGHITVKLSKGYMLPPPALLEEPGRRLTHRHTQITHFIALGPIHAHIQLFMGPEGHII